MLEVLWLCRTRNGHADYVTVTPGRTIESYRNERYTTIFDDLIFNP